MAKHLDPRVITVRKRRQEKFYNNNLVSRETIDERKKSEQNWGKKIEKKKGCTFVPVYRVTGLMAAINESLIGVHDVSIKTVSISTRTMRRLQSLFRIRTDIINHNPPLFFLLISIVPISNRCRGFSISNPRNDEVDGCEHHTRM